MTHIIIPEGLKENWENFYQHYDFEEILTATGKPAYFLKKKENRVCRFCGRSYNPATFNMDAHIIADLFGKNNYYSEYECDDCNIKFSNYEGDLSRYIGGLRSLFGIKAKKGVPDYNPNHKSPITIKNFPNNFKIIERHNIQDDSIVNDRENNEVILSFTKENYKPLYAYKSLLKIGIALLRNEDVQNYQYALKLLQQEELLMQPKEFAQMFVARTNVFHNYPIAVLFKKIDPLESLPTHIVGLFSSGLFMQIFLPKSLSDHDLANTDKMNIFFSTPFLLSNPKEKYVILDSKLVDLSSIEEVSTEKEIFTFKYDTTDAVVISKDKKEF